MDVGGLVFGVVGCGDRKEFWFVCVVCVYYDWVVICEWVGVWEVD